MSEHRRRWESVLLGIAVEDDVEIEAAEESAKLRRCFGCDALHTHLERFTQMPYFLKRLNGLCRYTKQNGKSLVNSSVNPWNVQAAFLSLNIIQCLLDEPVSVGTLDEIDH
uniref:Uncharacterized protein n=1 Tax=Trichuris muris TaxID=70415 RepID=A0A5S6Q7J1_TRIMR